MPTPLLGVQRIFRDMYAQWQKMQAVAAAQDLAAANHRRATQWSREAVAKDHAHLLQEDLDKP